MEIQTIGLNKILSYIFQRGYPGEKFLITVNARFSHPVVAVIEMCNLETKTILTSEVNESEVFVIPNSESDNGSAIFCIELKAKADASGTVCTSKEIKIERLED